MAPSSRGVLAIEEVLGFTPELAEAAFKKLYPSNTFLVIPRLGKETSKRVVAEGRFDDGIVGVSNDTKDAFKGANKGEACLQALLLHAEVVIPMAIVEIHIFIFTP